MSVDRPLQGSAAIRESGPDFLCIGLQKAGTRWLYDLLQFEPGFWMPPFKEFHFFNRPSSFQRAVQRHHVQITKEFRWASKKRSNKSKRLFDERDIGFIDHAITYNENDATIDWYKGLFEPKGDLISGGVTPGYSTLNRSTIESIARSLPRLRLILLLRDPVSRAWSAFNKQTRKLTTGSTGKPGAGTSSIFDQTTSVKEIAEFMSRSATKKRSFPTQIYSRWCNQFDTSQMKYFFFDDIVKTPSAVRKELRSFFNLPDTALPVVNIGLDFNRKSKYPKRQMNDEAQEFLVEIFRDELLRCAEVFGGAAEHWPRRYGID